MGTASSVRRKTRQRSGIPMELPFQAHNDNSVLFHFERSRLNNLFKEAVRYPLVVACAGAGYGKTSAVHDFAQEYQATTAWIQLSERDNVGARFWENYVHSMSKVNEPLAMTIAKLGFPDTRDKMNRYLDLLKDNVKMKRRIIVMDDFHYIEDPAVLRFVEEGVVLSMPPGTSVFLISRSTPLINIAGLVSKGQMFNINENDLRFSDGELAQYFQQLDISLQADSLREIMQDTEGWAFAINLIARSYQKAPGYGGYLRSAMKSNIFRLMETEIWDGISERLQCFLIRLSLIDHLSVDLIALLAGGDEELLSEMEKQNAYMRRDSYINAYHIHPLFLEFLAQKQEFLTEAQKRETYTIAGNWCDRNGFKIDALSYYEKIGDYESIVASFFALPVMMPSDIAKYAAAIFDRAPPQAFDTVEFLAAMHLRSYIGQGLWKESVALAKFYEEKYLKMPEDNPFRKRTLTTIYYCLGFLRGISCTTDDRYDFDVYFEKFAKCVFEPPVFRPSTQCEDSPLDLVKLGNHCPGPWINRAGSSRKGGPDEFIDTLSRALSYASPCFNGLQTGEDELARGELKFYQGDIRAAEPFIVHALAQSRENRKFEIMHRALFYILRIAIVQGNFEKAEQALKEIKSQLDESEYLNRFVNHDLAVSWYYCILGLPEKVSHWLKENFSPYTHAAFIENFGNQIKAHFCFATRYYPPLLSYIEEMKQRESYLFGRVEMLAMEACVHYKMKNKEKAFTALLEAYKEALPNNLLMPFIEMGKDMRTLTTAMLKESDSGIPKLWLESVNRKAASYAKHQAHIATEYREARGLADGIVISPRETEILSDLSHGLSRAEIAASRNLSINTVKMVINNIYMKLGAENLADVIRIAVERKMI